MKKVLILLTALLLVSSVYALDLSQYPDPFLRNGRFDAVLVVGDKAKAEDVVGITDIAMSLQYESKIIRKLFVQGYGDVELNDIIRIDVGAVQLASRVNDQFMLQNMIVVGGPCANPIAAELLGHPEDCTEGFEYGKAKIKLFEHKHTNRYTLLVAGLLADDTRAAAQVLANYKDYNFNGDELIITDTSKTRPKVSVVS